MDRRKFLTNAGLGAAGAAGAVSLATPAITQERIEMAIVATWGRDFPGLGTGAQRYAQKIQDLSDEILQSSLYIYPLKNVKKSNSWGVQRSIWSQAYTPKLDITLFSSLSTDYNISINDSNGNNVYKSEGKLDKGFNFISYNLMDNNEYLDKGLYKVLIITDKDNLEKEFQIQ